MLEDALSFPTTADDWLQTVVIGGVLSLLGFLILPTIVVYGYLVRVVRAGATGGAAPSFTDWGELLVDGLRLLALVLVASLVVVVPLAVVAGFGSALAGATGSRVFAGVVGLGVLLVVLVATLALGYVLPAAVVNFVLEDSLAAALDAGTVLEGALTREYAIAWLLALLVGFVGATVGGPLTVVVVGIFLVFYTQVVAAYLFGRGFAAGIGIDRAAATPAAGGGQTPPSRNADGAIASGGKGAVEAGRDGTGGTERETPATGSDPTTTDDASESTDSGPETPADDEGETGPDEGETGTDGRGSDGAGNR